MSLILILFCFYLFQAIAFEKGFEKAGYNRYLAFIPFYNTFIALKIISRPWWWVILAYLPVIGNIVMLVILYEWLHCFGYGKKRYLLLTILSFGFFSAYVLYKKETKFLGRNEQEIKKNIPSWLNATLFAVTAASAIHTYVIQPFTIPTSSLEKSLLVGDFLFVSKFHYGVRIPMTPLSLPMVHDTIPIVGVKSYLPKPQLPYLRLPAFQKIERNDIVVFNWPTDTVRFFRDKSKIHAYKPIDKKSNYVKRAVGVPGDTFEIRNGVIYINGKESILPERAKIQYSYIVKTKENVVLTPQWLYDNFGVTDGMYQYDNNIFEIRALTSEGAEKLKNLPEIERIEKVLLQKDDYKSHIFPHSKKFPWNEDNMGAIKIPSKGSKIDLNIDNLPIYRRIIEEYEQNSLQIEGSSIKINGKEAKDYTFKQDYYWMMGDNRHNSEDSRFWGFVPFDHIVGKPVLIWFSVDANAKGLDKIRWERLFTTINGEGEPVSYRYWVLIIGGILYIAYEIYTRKKRKEKY